MNGIPFIISLLQCMIEIEAKSASSDKKINNLQYYTYTGQFSSFFILLPLHVSSHAVQDGGKLKVCVWKFPPLVSPKKFCLCLLIHSQAANNRKSHLNPPNLALFLLLNPVQEENDLPVYS